MHGKLDDGLGDECGRVQLDAPPRYRQFLAGSLGPDHNSVAARRSGGFDHITVEIAQHRLSHIRLAQQIGIDNRQNRFLAQIVANHCRRVGEDRLVVGDSGADRVGQRRVAGTQDGSQAGDAQQGIGTENDRIEEVIIDAAIQDVDAAKTMNRLHEQFVIDAYEVASLDEFDAHLLRQEYMFEKGGVERAGRQQRDSRIRDAAGRQILEAGEQVGRVVFHA